jgi:hypothetical protein
MFQGWDNFYLMVGGSAGGLIGLMFVVATLTSELERDKVTRGQDLFLTPTVVLFATVLTIAALAAAPGLAKPAQGLGIGLIAIAGLIYIATVIVRMLGPAASRPPHWSDPWWYAGAPAGVYLGLGLADVAVWTVPGCAPYAIAVVTLGMLLVGIRNAWDLVTWMSPRRRPDQP